MKLYRLIFLFLASSFILVFFAIKVNLKPLNDKRLEVIRLSKIQKVCMKAYPRKRKLHIPMRSFSLAQQEIDAILEKQALVFVSNSASLDDNSTVPMKKVLTNLLMVIEHVREEVILSIETHTDGTGSKQHNLQLSQKRADVLKEYFLDRSNIPLIVAIGYGEELPLLKESKTTTNRRVEIHLKRIKK